MDRKREDNMTVPSMVRILAVWLLLSPTQLEIGRQGFAGGLLLLIDNILVVQPGSQILFF